MSVSQDEINSVASSLRMVEDLLLTQKKLNRIISYQIETIHSDLEEFAKRVNLAPVGKSLKGPNRKLYSGGTPKPNKRLSPK